MQMYHIAYSQASDVTFLQKCHLNHLRRRGYGKPRSKEKLEFCVKHYAGPVYYTVLLDGHFLISSWVSVT